MMEERRERHRSVVSVPFKVSHKSFGTITVNSRDLSVGGIFAVHEENQQIPEPGTVIRVEVLGAVGDAASEIEAEVVRIEDGGFGLRFLYVDYEDTGPAE